MHAKSLRIVYENDTSLHPVRFSMLNYRKQEWMENIPLYAALVWLKMINHEVEEKL